MQRLLLRGAFPAAWWAGALLLAATTSAAQSPPAANTCVTCHSTQADVRIATPAALFKRADVHRESGFACADCHGGDPTADDKARAHDVAKLFKGKPQGAGDCRDVRAVPQRRDVHA